MGQIRNLVCSERTAETGVIGPATNAGIEEGAVDDELTATREEVEKTQSPVRPVECVVLLRPPSTAFVGVRLARESRARDQGFFR